MLEPYAAKVARTVLRRGGASDRVFLVYLGQGIVKLVGFLKLVSGKTGIP